MTEATDSDGTLILKGLRRLPIGLDLREVDSDGTLILKGLRLFTGFDVIVAKF